MPSIHWWSSYRRRPPYRCFHPNACLFRFFTTRLDISGFSPCFSEAPSRLQLLFSSGGEKDRWSAKVPRPFHPFRAFMLGVHSFQGGGFEGFEVQPLLGMIESHPLTSTELEPPRRLFAKHTVTCSFPQRTPLIPSPSLAGGRRWKHVG